MTAPVWPHLDAYEPVPHLAGFRPVIGDRGMVSTPHALASMIGLDVLKEGGNAVDAAIAASAALMVTSPMQCGPGGDAFWLIAEGAEVSALDASGRSAAAADAVSLRAQGLCEIPPRSGYAVTVPGAVDGWVTAHRRYGTRPLPALLEPAASLAERGVYVSRHIHASFSACEAALRSKAALPLWSDADCCPRLYERLRQPALARSLRDIGASNGEAFYAGPLADAIAAAVVAAGGWLTADDLAAHRSDWVTPLRMPYGDMVLHTTPPPSQGLSLFLAWRMAEAVGALSAAPESAAAVHGLVEAVAAALALRDALNDDPARIAADLDAIGRDAVAAFGANFDPERRGEATTRRAQDTTKGDTAHLVVADGRGMSVSLIQSLFFDFGSCIPVPAGGFTLQNRGAAFHLDASRPGVLEPGLRPRSTLMPCLATRRDRTVLLMGCMGGDGQMQTCLQILADLAGSAMDPQQSVSRPRWFLERSAQDGPVLMVERGVAPDVLVGLGRRGHRIEQLGPREDRMGHAQVILVARGGALVGAADPRSDGQVAAF